MTSKGHSGVRRRQRRRAKALRLAVLMRKIAGLPRAKRIRIIAKIEDALAAAVAS